MSDSQTFLDRVGLTAPSNTGLVSGETRRNGSAGATSIRHCYVSNPSVKCLRVGECHDMSSLDRHTNAHFALEVDGANGQ